jgi:hypothetical protein
VETTLALTCARCMRDQLMHGAYHIRLANCRSPLLRDRCGFPCSPALARCWRHVFSIFSLIATIPSS